MYMLRDPLFTYEVCHAADLRRPPTSAQRYERAWARELARTLGRDPANRRRMAALVELSVGRASPGPLLVERFAELVSCGRLVVREVSAADGYPLPDPDAQPVVGLVQALELDQAPPVVTPAVLGLEVVHQGGGRFPGARFRLLLPDGRSRDVVLDGDSRWRADDIPSGPCTLEPCGPLVLERDEYITPSSAPIVPGPADVLVPRDDAGGVDLRPGAERRLVVLQPRPSPVRTFPAASFTTGRAFPTAAVIHGLGVAAEAATHDPRQRFGLYGHADVTGHATVNKTLSERRARAVLSLLTADRPMFEAVARDDRWGTVQYQAMLRTLGCDPGPVDGALGPLTRRAVRAFREEYRDGVFHESGVRHAEHGELPAGDALDEAARAAIRDAYHGQHAVRIAPARFMGPRASGCGEFNPIGGDRADDRRVTLVLYGDDPPRASEFPCRPGDPGACTLDERGVARCRFYREHVEEPPYPPVELPFWDFRWLPGTQRRVHLSALTALPDADDAEFRVFLWAGARPRSESGSGDLDASPHHALAVLAGVIRSGVAHATWRPPEGYDPFDPRAWFRRPEQQRRDLWLPRYKPPGFSVHHRGYWGTSGPPAHLHRDVYRSPAPAGPVVALRDDGVLLLNLDAGASHRDAATHRIVNLLGPEPHHPRDAPP